VSADPIYGPVDDDIYRSIEAGQGPEHARFLYDLTLVAVNYETNPDLLDHLIHKWGLDGKELKSAQDFIAGFGPGGVFAQEATS
jgi:hypothetical protein